ncbi:MAG: C40 family peptidase [Rhizobiales bacterium]|nr:C40 family peptidase [Hyphomicrobiales bacterium]
MAKLDQRLNAYRPDLADARLRGLIAAGRFVEGRLMQVVDALIAVHQAPRFDSMQISQALMGETLHVFEAQEGWAFVQLERDNYVGYVSADALSSQMTVPTHRIAVPSTFLYPAPDIKTQPATIVTMNAAVTVTGDDEKFAQLANGRFVYRYHLQPIGKAESDFVTVAEMFRHAPYCWGGKSVHGLDCSGLVQLSLEACGIACPRDTDMQEEHLGTALLVNDLDGLKRGDLVFWSGHVGIMIDEGTLFHANGHHMTTVAEPLRNAVDRIATGGNQVTSIKRL